ncbi:MAG: tRNA (adenine-N1)-methyltransferase [Deferribacteraceae bacterium]|jgi:tRNA (adenine57-N1/adenine58-N1)-methyltransferase|nr:tRNA (adenine-N1)-methyltransferase [Deferribacteraceae bacterium]
MNEISNEPLGYKIVILTDKKKHKHMITLKEKGRFSSQYGYIDHDVIAAVPSGSVVYTVGGGKTSGGHPYRVFDVTYRDYVMHIKRQAQIIYPKDTAAMLMWGDIAPHQNILESGVGQGGLSMAVLRALGGTGKLTSYELRQDFADMSKKFISTYFGYSPENHSIEVRDIYKGIDGVYDRVLLDLPEPWQVTPHLKDALQNGGMLVSYIPTVLQVKSMVDSIRACGYFDEIETFELILRPWKVEGLSVRPEMWIYNHSAFIVTARKCIPMEARPLPEAEASTLPQGEGGEMEEDGNDSNEESFPL